MTKFYQTQATRKVAAALFSKISIMKKLSFAWQLLKLTGEINIESERMMLDKKFFFLWLNPFSGNKYPNSMTHYLCDAMPPKPDKLLNSNFVV